MNALNEPGSKKRNTIIDIAKGIGIISVVVGHAFNTDLFYGVHPEMIRRFVYLYHLVIFIVCSGFCFKEYKFNVFLNRKIKGIYIPFVSASIFSLFFFEIFNKLNITDIKTLGIANRLKNILLIWRNAGILTSALWFVPVLFWINIIAYVVMKTTHRVILRRIIFSAVLLAAMLVFYYRTPVLWQAGYIRFILLFLPFFYLGYEIKKAGWLSRISSRWLLPTGILMIILNRVTNLQIEVTKGLLYGYWGFAPMTLLGLVFCIALAKTIEGSKIESVFIFIGKKSFYIMAWHFIGFKLLDAVLSKLADAPRETTLLFPFSFPKLRLAYIVVGLSFPLILAFINDKLKYNAVRILNYLRKM